MLQPERVADLVQDRQEIVGAERYAAAVCVLKLVELNQTSPAEGSVHGK